MLRRCTLLRWHGLLALVAGVGVTWSFGYFLGRDPCVAFLFVLVGIKFLEARSTRDGTVLVCLASFLFVTPFFYSQSPFSALAAGPAVLLIGATLEVLARPSRASGRARPIGSGHCDAPPNCCCRASRWPCCCSSCSRRLAAPLWGLPSDHGSATGLSERMSPGSISELSLSDAVAFRVDFDGAVPPPIQRYWRGPVLTRFDGREWTVQPQRLDGAIIPSRTKPVAYTVTLEPHNKPWLFALDLPAALPRAAIDEDPNGGVEIAGISRAQQLMARALVSQPMRYQQLSVMRDRYPADTLRDSAENLRLPRAAKTGTRGRSCSRRNCVRSIPTMPITSARS